MADEEEHDSGGEEEEQEDFPLYLPVKDSATFQKLLSSPTKVIAVAFLIDGYGHCEAVKEWLEALGEESSYSGNVQFAIIDPDTLPEVARKCGINSLPGFAFFWRRSIFRVFSGTNQDKYMFNLNKMIEQKTKEIDDSKLKNLPQPQLCCGPGDKVDVFRGNRRMNTAVLTVSWGHIPSQQLWGVTICAGCLTADNILLSNDDFVYSGNAQNGTESVVYKGTVDSCGDSKDKSVVHAHITSTIDITFAKLDASVQSIPIVVHLTTSNNDEKVRYLSQVFNLSVQLSNKDNESKVPFKYNVDMLNNGVPVTANAVYIGSFIKDQTGKWSFECAAQGMIINDINQMMQQYKAGTPFRGYVPPTTTPIMTAPAKLYLQRVRPTEVRPLLEFGWECPGNPLTNAYVGAIVSTDADCKTIHKNKQTVIYHNGDKVNNNNSITLTVNNNTQTVQADLKLASLSQDVCQIIFMAIPKNNTELHNGYTIIRDKDNVALGKIVRDYNTQAQASWITQQEEIVAKWRSNVYTLQNQSMKTKDKEKEASYLSQMEVLPDWAPLPELVKPNVLPLGALVKRKMPNNGPTQWEYWSDPPVDANALVGVVKSMAE